MRILFYGSNPYFEHGMGKVGVELCRELTKAGHDVKQYSPDTTGPARDFELDDGTKWEVYGQPNPGGPGIGMFRHYVGKLDPDLVLTNRNWQGLDWMSDALNDRYMNFGEKVPLLLYGPPVETEEKPPMFSESILNDHLNDVWMVPYTKNRYENMNEEWGVDSHLLPESHPNPWVPHGVNSEEIFYPDCHEDHNERDDQMNLRDGMGIENRFMGLYIGENWRRKNLDILLDAWKRFRDRVIDDGGNRPFLMLHTDPAGTRGDDQFYSGWNIIKTAKGFGLNPATSFNTVSEEADLVVSKEHTGAFYPRRVVASYMSTADVYCLPSSGEGFSLTTLEAMSCGTPIVQTGVETLEWLAGDAARYIDTVQPHAINTGERMPVPSTESLAEELYEAWSNDQWRQDAAEAGRKRAVEFPWKRMGDEMVDVVEFVEETSI